VCLVVLELKKDLKMISKEVLLLQKEWSIALLLFIEAPRLMMACTEKCNTQSMGAPTQTTAASIVLLK
jgi:hypothetical protein